MTRHIPTTGAPPENDGGRPCPTPTLPRPSSRTSRSAARPAEYLEAGGGSPLTPAADPRRRWRRRSPTRSADRAAASPRWPLVGVGAWAAANFFATGAQPSEALPAATIGYASIDLDPSGGQKIEALRTLNKFPAFKEELGLDADDDIRQALFEELDLPEDCKIFYAEDIEPWLGERVAVAAVDPGRRPRRSSSSSRSRTPTPPRPGLSKVRDCGGRQRAPAAG